MTRFLIIIIVLGFSRILLANPNFNLGEKGQLEFPFKLVNGLIIVEAEINNVSGEFVFDTGTTEIILNRETQEKGNSEFESINGSLEVLENAEAEIVIGQTHLGKHNTFSTDLKLLREYLSLDLLGIIGAGIFNPYNIAINYSNESILIYSDRIQPILSNPSSCEIEDIDGLVLMKGKFENKNYFFIIDSGTSTSIIDKRIFRRHKKCFSENNIRTGLVTASDQSDSVTKVSTDDFSINEHKFANADFLVTDLSHISKTLNRKIAGVISLNLFTSDLILIDFQTEKLSF